MGHVYCFYHWLYLIIAASISTNVISSQHCDQSFLYSLYILFFLFYNSEKFCKRKLCKHLLLCYNYFCARLLMNHCIYDCLFVYWSMVSSFCLLYLPICICWIRSLYYILSSPCFSRVCFSVGRDFLTNLYWNLYYLCLFSVKGRKLNSKLNFRIKFPVLVCFLILSYQATAYVSVALMLYLGWIWFCTLHRIHFISSTVFL